MTNNKSGYIAELLASVFLRLKGYRILARNFKTKRGTLAGEVDIIAQCQNTIIFVEVKKRKSIDDAAYSIKPSQQKRVSKGAELYLKQNPKYQNHNIRFDAILIKLPLKIKHIKSAWLS